MSSENVLREPENLNKKEQSMLFYHLGGPFAQFPQPDTIPPQENFPLWPYPTMPNPNPIAVSGPSKLSIVHNAPYLVTRWYLLLPQICLMPFYPFLARGIAHIAHSQFMFAKWMSKQMSKQIIKEKMVVLLIFLDQKTAQVLSWTQSVFIWEDSTNEIMNTT